MVVIQLSCFSPTSDDPFKTCLEELLSYIYNRLNHLHFKADRVSRNQVAFSSINVILRLWRSRAE